MSVAEWQRYEITCYHLECFSEKSRSFIVRIWINKNLYHAWHFKWVSYNFPSLKPLPQSVQRSLYWPVWTDKWYFKFISLVYDLSQYSHLYFLPSCPLMCILKLVVSLKPFLQMWRWKRKCPVCSCSCLFKLDIAVNCLSHFSNRKFRRRFREDNFRPFSFNFSSKNPWGVLDCPNFGCFVSSRFQHCHCIAMEKLNQGACELSQNSGNRAHPW